jgi:transposase-like protein
VTLPSPEGIIMAGRKITNEGEARQLLAEATRRGVDRVSFARQRGIDARSLNAWRINLERRAHVEEPPPLRLLELVPQAAHEPRRQPYRIHVDGVVIEVPFDCPPATLAALVRAVGAC